MDREEVVGRQGLTLATGCSEERQWVPTSTLSLGLTRVCVPLSPSLVLKGWGALFTHNTQLRFFSFKEA